MRYTNNASFNQVYLNIKESTGQHEQDYLRCLESRQMDARFTFWGRESTQAWLKLTKSKKYSLYDTEISLLKRKVKEISEEISITGLNFISLCCAAYEPERIVVQELIRKRKILYSPLESSIDLINSSLVNILPIGEVDILPFISSIYGVNDASEILKKDYNKTNLICLLCNAVGNYPQIDLLSTIRASMESSDYFLVSFQLLNEEKEQEETIRMGEIVSCYHNEEYHALLSALIDRSGFKMSDGKFEIEFGPNKLYPNLKTLEIFFSLLKDKNIQYLGKELVYKKGERILLRYSYIYTAKEAISLLENNGFQIIKSFINEKKDYMLVLCKANV